MIPTFVCPRCPSCGHFHQPRFAIWEPVSNSRLPELLWPLRWIIYAIGSYLRCGWSKLGQALSLKIHPGFQRVLQKENVLLIIFILVIYWSNDIVGISSLLNLMSTFRSHLIYLFIYYIWPLILRLSEWLALYSRLAELLSSRPFCLEGTWARPTGTLANAWCPKCWGLYHNHLIVLQLIVSQSLIKLRPSPPQWIWFVSI